MTDVLMLTTGIGIATVKGMDADFPFSVLARMVVVPFMMGVIMPV